MNSITLTLVRLAVGGARELPRALGPRLTGNLAARDPEPPLEATDPGVFPAYAYAPRAPRRRERARGLEPSSLQIHVSPTRRICANRAGALTQNDGGMTWNTSSDSSA